jgi:hypothetical protein
MLFGAGIPIRYLDGHTVQLKVVRGDLQEARAVWPVYLFYATNTQVSTSVSHLYRKNGSQLFFASKTMSPLRMVY